MKPSNFFQQLDGTPRLSPKPRRQWRQALECAILATAVIVFLILMIVLAEVVGIT